MGKDASEAGSDKSELKKLIRLSRDKPVHMAFALGQDGKAILKLDKMKPPRTLEKGLKESEGSRNHRFGTVMVDPEQPKVVTFVLNKAVSGFARKLVIALKGTGFKQVKLVTEDGEALEEAESDEDDGDEDDDAPPFSVAGDEEAATSRREMPDAEMPVSPSIEATPAPGEAAGPDAGELTRTLAGLVKQMIVVIGRDPTQKAALTELAVDAQASLKRGDLAQVAAGIDILRMAVGDAEAAGPVDAIDPEKANQAVVQKLRKSRVAWTATRANVDAQLEKLSSAILAASDGEDDGSDLESQFYATVEPLLADLDDTLSDVLDRAADAEGEDREELLAEARSLIGDYSAFVDGNAVIQQLDDNPFQKLTVGKTLTATLGTLSRMMA